MTSRRLSPAVSGPPVARALAIAALVAGLAACSSSGSSPASAGSGGSNGPGGSSGSNSAAQLPPTPTSTTTVSPQAHDPGGFVVYPHVNAAAHRRLEPKLIGLTYVRSATYLTSNHSLEVYFAKGATVAEHHHIDKLVAKARR